MAQNNTKGPKDRSRSSNGATNTSSNGRGQRSKSTPGRNEGSRGGSDRERSQGRMNANGTNGMSNGRSRASTGQHRTHGRGDENTGLMKLFTHQLADMFYVERQLLKALDKMARTAESDELRKAFDMHHQETEGQVERLEEVFDLLDRSARGKKCDAIDGILDEAKELMSDFKDDPALDAALVCAAQKVEHYEIATYGTLIAWAEELGLNEAADLLNEILEEEKAADEKLSELAEAAINASGQREHEAAEEEEDDRGTNDNGRGPVMEEQRGRGAGRRQFVH